MSKEQDIQSGQKLIAGKMAELFGQMLEPGVDAAPYRSQMDDLMGQLFGLSDQLPMDREPLTRERAALLEDEELLAYAMPDFDPQQKPERLSALSPIRRSAYVLRQFMLEYDENGLCGYLENGGWRTAPYLAEAFTLVGVPQAWDCISAFLSAHHLTLSDLKQLSGDDRLYRRYDFNTVDDQLCSTDAACHLDARCAELMRNHINEWIGTDIL